MLSALIGPTRRNVGIVNIGILYTVYRGWRDANRTAAGTAALQRRFPSGEAAIDFARGGESQKPRPVAKSATRTGHHLNIFD